MFTSRSQALAGAVVDVPPSIATLSVWRSSMHPAHCDLLELGEPPGVQTDAPVLNDDVSSVTCLYVQ
jgi:hypothetical protein